MNPLSCTVEAVIFLVKFGLNWPTSPELEWKKMEDKQGW